MVFLWASIGFSIWMIGASFWVTLLLLAVAIGVTIHLFMIKTFRPETTKFDELTEADETA